MVLAIILGQELCLATLGSELFADILEKMIRLGEVDCYIEKHTMTDCIAR